MCPCCTALPALTAGTDEVFSEAGQTQVSSRVAEERRATWAGRAQQGLKAVPRGVIGPLSQMQETTGLELWGGGRGWSWGQQG